MPSAFIPSSPPPALRLGEFLRSIRFRPAIVDAFHGYTTSQFTTDVLAGLVVGIVALPLGIAFAIASGADPRAGLITAALAGFLVGALGGSRVQIAGPTGAFVVILYGIVQGFGFEKLLVAGFLAGVMLLFFGLLKLGNLIKFIPYPVTTGFTAGIAVIIFLGQLPHILGLRLNEVRTDEFPNGVAVPADTIEKLELLAHYLERISGRAVIATVLAILIIQLTKRYIPRVPGPAVALAVLTPLAVFVPSLSVQTVGDLYTLPTGLPAPSLPDVSPLVLREMLVPAFTIALLGAIESLLSAVVADGMAGTKHDSNQELMGQGLANMIIPLFGGIAATGAIARTGTNVQLGARTPLASILHGAVVLVVLLSAGPLVAYIPMAVLAGILAVVAWNMSERHRFAKLLKMPVGDAGVMLATFLLTVLVDLTVAVEVGMVLAAALFLGRMAQTSQVNVITPDTDPVYQQHSLQGKQIPEGTILYSVDGPFFFGAAEKFQDTIDRIAKDPKVVIFRVRRVPYMDATGINALTIAVQQLQKRGVTVLFSGVQAQPLDMMLRSGFTKIVGDENLQPNIDAALSRARVVLGLPSVAPTDPGASPPAR